MFEDARVVEVGVLENFSYGVLGYRLQLPNERLITVTGLTIKECQEVARLLDAIVSLRLVAH